MSNHQVDHIEMQVPAKSEYIGVVRLTLSGVANRLGFSYDDIEDMKIAIAEACTNVVNHAYEGDGIINISYRIYENEKIEIIVSDKGQSFDVNKVHEKLGPIDAKKPVTELKEGGLGLYLINTLMDKVEIHEESGVVVIMTKFMQGDEVEQHVNGFPSARTEQR
ncbi:serine-protein kinase [Alkalihalobacillus alcalophilus ATCC 27647 = CGMCC 1.3604]|uniref:Serine-protein kinase RsbW n=1 Tax=Alkalihalobacillus alcalophilus ATCC 27647 = CGMCC 1.3604 TaxID=1218173 RepID=A0A094XBN8_ALKAL|nr:anti-sigma B factor RsbW [Alkalihalobacillus alcalophilus]KGA96210.1 serine/threonine protein kinase [Alkalihalobacillus alcalophilus ATCC 27647 = CGMCC 1.3604]MED1563010.1 anti-sigma B factor RsbW [Alkalihalobacillus alcalophilus]THG92305.1 serine-protein kinase [Alkalihalobacillus alcalophilus ATCC 27647 = CGMCC 1.3604]